MKKINEIEIIVRPHKDNEIIIDGVSQGFFSVPIIMDGSSQTKGHYKFIRKV